MPKVYTVLFSAASEAVYGPDLVSHERYGHAADAFELGERVKRVSGLEYEVMHLTDNGWRSANGQSAIEVIRARWSG